MAKKRYYNQTENRWYTEGSVLMRKTKGEIWGGVPTVAQLTAWGYVEYVEPQVEPVVIPIEQQYKDLVISKIRLQYSIDDELAIQRQRDTKTEEFAAYNAYCEQCKADAKDELGIEEKGGE